MNNEEFLSSPENREAVEIISQRVLAEVEPEELELAPELIEPLMDLAARDEVHVYDPAREAGGFGSADLIAFAIVPIVVRTLGSFLLKLGVDGIDKLKSKVQAKLIELIKAEVEKQVKKQVEEQAAEVFRRTGPSKARGRSKEVKRVIAQEVSVFIEQIGDRVVVARGGGQTTTQREAE